MNKDKPILDNNIPITLEEYCKRVGLPYPLPEPNSPEANKLLSDMFKRKINYG